MPLTKFEPVSRCVVEGRDLCRAWLEEFHIGRTLRLRAADGTPLRMLYVELIRLRVTTLT